MLHVPKRNQHLIKSSLPTSHGYVPIDRPGKPKINNPLPPSDLSAFLELFAFVGTMDYAPYLCIPAAIKFRRDICGGEEAIMAYCNGIVRQGTRRVAEILGTDVLGDEKQRECPMAMVRLPIRLGTDVAVEHEKLVGPFIERSCFDRHHTFVPVTFHNGNWWVRLSGQVYLDIDDFDRVGTFLYQICNAVKSGAPWSQTPVSRL
jgi:selenocysteine lyase/cysteine desulfurase